MKKIILGFFMLIFPYLGISQINEGFEGLTFPPLTPGSWLVANNGVGTNVSWAETTNATLIFAGNKSAIIDRENVGNGNTSQDWLITPQITVPANGQLKFNTRQTLVGNNGSLYEIRVSTNPTQNNLAAFTTAQSWTETTLNTTFNVYEEKIVDLNAFAAQQVYIAFVRVHTQVGAATTGDRWLIDNIRTVQQCLAPAVLGVGTVNPTSAQLTWATNGTPINFDVEIMPVANNPTGTPNNTGVSNPFTVGGLLPGTAYKYYVRANCGGGNFSAWVGPFNFLTTAAGSVCATPILIGALPYSATSNTNLYGDEVDVIQGTSCGATPATTNFLQGAEVFYSYTAPTTGNISVSMTPGTTAATSSSIFVYNGCASFPATCIAGVANTNATPRNIPIIPVVAGNTYIFVISSSTTPAAGIPYTLIIQDVNCAPPAALAATNIGTTNADLSWSNPSGATSWQLAIQPAGSGIPTGVGVTVGTNTNYPATGLTAATAYQYWVRADCGGGLFSAWSGPFLFNTNICDAALRCNYTFRMTDSFGDGWNGNTMSIRQNGVTVATIGSTFTAGAGPVNIVVPLCENYPFELFWNSGGSFAGEVGISVINNFNQTLFTKAPGTGAQNTLLFTSSFDCDTPACIPPTTLAATAITASGATLGWTGGTAWNVYVVPFGQPAPNASTVPTYLNATNPLIITGLTAGTAYQFYVQTLCSATSVSPWSAVGNFITNPGCGGSFFDNGGPTTNYTNNADQTITICPTNPGDKVTVTFTSFNTEATWDGLYVFDGGTITSPQISSGNPIGNGPLATLAGAFWGTAIPGPFTSTAANGCLTFRFRSDGLFNNPGWVASVTCAPPPTCSKPLALTATGATQTTVNLGWTQPANPNSTFASAWEVLALPCGSPAPTATSTGWIAAGTNPYTLTNLTPNTCYVYYVRAVCSPTDSGPIAGPRQFNTLIINDECTGAIQAPVNQNTNCLQTVFGSIAGATGSTQPNSCGGTIDDDDAWFFFNATATLHYVSLLNATGALNYALYTGNNCGALTQVGGCTTANGGVATGLVIGQRYYVRVYSPGTVATTRTFSLCIGSKVSTCPTASQLCALNPIVLPNNVGVPSNPNPISGGTNTTIGCLGSAPSPTFYYFTVPLSGNYSFFIEQNTNITFNGTGLDVDFVAWGPYPNAITACNTISTANTSPAPNGCSFSAAPTETYTLNNAIAGQVYVLMITNYTASQLPGRQGFIRISQTAGPVPTSCCPYTNFSYSSSFYCKDGTNPSPIVFVGAQSGVFSSNLPGLVIDPVTGTIDLAASTAGNYIVSNTIAGNASCATAASSWSITISEPPTATIAYSAPAFCRSVSTVQTVIFTGTTGGVYSALPAGLSLNPTTGAITPNTSLAGNYTVTYTIFAQAGCSNRTATTTVTITPSQVATFNYDAATYCQNGANPVIAYTGGGVAGIFTSTTGLSINASTGAINLASSTPGLYTITNSIAASGGCPAAVSTFDITITAPPVATFSFASPFCSNAGNALPAYSGGGVAGIFTATTGLTIDANTGEINVSTSTAGNYIVTNTIIGTGGCGNVIATLPITITTLPTATITYTTSNQFCYNGSLENVTLTSNATGSNGTYTATPSGLNINATSGEINPSSSTAGNYMVTYTVASNGGCPAVIATIPVVIKPEATITIEEDCIGSQFNLVANVTNAGSASVTYNWLNSAGGTVSNENPAPIQNPGIYTLEVTVNGCDTTKNITVASTICVIPKGISPTNPTFDLTGLGVNKLEIFNRYGTLVFDKKDYTNEWKGQTNNGSELPVGTYYYLINMNTGESKSGWVYINK